MRRSTRFAAASGLLALASRASAQVASVCPTTDVCYKLNIPETTASSGNGDIFFQISAPSNYEWVALGQGNRMSGSNIFVVYTSNGGSNVTLSPRSASGYSMPSFNSDAQVTLLEGSGVSNGKMVANVRCSNCNSWTGGSADFTQGNGNWVYAFHSSGGPKNSDSQSASISQHNSQNSFRWDYANAKGGNSVNPLLNAAAPSGSGSRTVTATSCIPRPAQSTGSGSAAATSTRKEDDDENDDRTQRGRPTVFPSQWQSGWPTARPTGTPWGPQNEVEHDDDDNNKKRSEKRADLPYCDEGSSNFTPIGLVSGTSNQTKMLIAHGTLAALAFVILFPSGAIAIRLASFPGIAWIHGAFQIFAYLVYTAAFGLGVYIANSLDLLDSYHPIIGIVVFVLLFFQPFFGFLHHMFYKKYDSRTAWSHVHLWIGRLAITLGIVNGGLGFRLANTMGMGSRSGMIAYSVVAGVMWLAWVAATIIGEKRRSRARADRPPKYSAESPTVAAERGDVPPNGHYAPK